MLSNQPQIGRPDGLHLYRLTTTHSRGGKKNQAAGADKSLAGSSMGVMVNWRVVA